MLALSHMSRIIDSVSVMEPVHAERRQQLRRIVYC